jgi:hypothetical protein
VTSLCYGNIEPTLLLLCRCVRTRAARIIYVCISQAIFFFRSLYVPFGVAARVWMKVILVSSNHMANQRGARLTAFKGSRNVIFIISHNVQALTRLLSRGVGFTLVFLIRCAYSGLRATTAVKISHIVGLNTHVSISDSCARRRGWCWRLVLPAKISVIPE